MDLIKQLGGYGRLKGYMDGALKGMPDSYCYKFNTVLGRQKLLNMSDVKSLLLKYRREHNIFEAGDKVVFHNLPYARLFYVKAVLDDSIVVHECWDEAGARCFSEFKTYLDIRHATDEEITAGHRL